MEDEYELNYLKINCNNDAKLTAPEDYELEMFDLITIIPPDAEEKGKIDGVLLKYYKKFIPPLQDLLKTNIDLGKQFQKNFHFDKKNTALYESVNRILSTDFKGKFIFNKINVQDVSIILSSAFSETKKYKISNFAEFNQALKKIDFQKYKFDKLYLNNEFVKNRSNTLNQTRSIRSNSSNSSITPNTPIKMLYDENIEIEDTLLYNKKKNFNNQYGISFIDNNYKNIICSSDLTDDYIYDEELVAKKVLTKDCFSFQKNNKEDSELPIELIILLYKLKDVNTLIYQINNVDEQFVKMAIYILINIQWLFMHDIEEIKYDIGNEELQKGIFDVYNERVTELYYLFNKEKNSLYYNGSYKARTVNLWEPEGDIIFVNRNEDDEDKINEYIYSNQVNKEECTYDNHLCNIYNEYGKLSNLKYIRPIEYTIKNKNNRNNIRIDSWVDADNSFFLEQRSERESIYLISNNNFNSRSSISFQNPNVQNSNNNNVEKTTPGLLKEYVKKQIYPFQMITIYSYFFIKEFKKLKRLCLFFNTSFSYEIQLMLRVLDIAYDRFHFLMFLNCINSLTEADFSFNALDSKSFETILGIINKNLNLSKLRLSLFTPEINYCDNSLFKIWSSKKQSIRKLFAEQKESLKFSNKGEKKNEINYFTLHHNKFLESFEKNIRSFFNLLRFIILNSLEELTFRFDIPISILNSEKYIILLIKFIINILIMITFQENKIKTLKLIAPELPLDSYKTPYISQLFNEILLEREQMDTEWNEKLKNEKKRKEKIRIKEKERTLKEQREKENELKEKKARKGKLENISSSISSKDLSNIMKEPEIDESLTVDVDDNLEQFDFSKRFKSVFQKTTPSYMKEEVRRNSSVASDKLDEQRRQLNTNDTLEHLTLQFKIYNLPKIFNILLMNNLKGLKYINIGYLDEISFISFVDDYKNNANKLASLTTLKISIGISVFSYSKLEKHVIEYINVNSPILEEKFLFSDLQINLEEQMENLVDLVYFKAVVPKLVIQIGNNIDNVILLSKVINHRISKRKTEMNALLMIMDLPQYKKLCTGEIIKSIAGFYAKKENRAILCKENPNNSK